MKNNRPVVLSIAGFDPSGGAGTLADIKTFESCDTYGIAVVSAITYQNDISFEKVEWLSIEQITNQLKVLKKRFDIAYIKIGLIESLDILNQLIDKIKNETPTVKIIWDPILKASAGFNFHKNNDKALLGDISSKIFLITPNSLEAIQLGIHNDAIQNSIALQDNCDVYLKGGHNEIDKGTDTLYIKNGEKYLLKPETTDVKEKHGSGCVLSSAITAYLAQGLELKESCRLAKKYTTNFLMSNESLLGYHNNLIRVEHG